MRLKCQECPLELSLDAGGHFHVRHRFIAGRVAPRRQKYHQPAREAAAMAATQPDTSLPIASTVALYFSADAPTNGRRPHFAEAPHASERRRLTREIVLMAGDIAIDDAT